MNLLVLVRILRFVLPAIYALFAAGNVPQISRNFGAGAGLLDSGFLQGNLLPAILASLSMGLASLIERKSGITKEGIELVRAIITYFRDPTRNNAFRAIIEGVGFIAAIAEKHIPEIAGNLSDIEQKLLAKLGPSAQVRNAIGRDVSARAA